MLCIDDENRRASRSPASTENKTMLTRKLEEQLQQKFMSMGHRIPQTMVPSIYDAAMRMFIADKDNAEFNDALSAALGAAAVTLDRIEEINDGVHQDFLRKCRGDVADATY